eukprot:14517208-Alexandrium_andersonii.AAC.1
MCIRDRYEADLRHAAQLLRDLRKFECSGVRGTSCPGYRRDAAAENADEPLGQAAGLGFRALAARANYFSVDRPDLGFAAKECCRRMAAPTTTDWAALVRLIRYLIVCRRCVYHFPWRDEGAALRAYVDADFAGCLLTR